MSTSSTRRSLLKLATGAAAYGAGVTTLSVGALVATATNTVKAATPPCPVEAAFARWKSLYIAMHAGGSDQKIQALYAIIRGVQEDIQNSSASGPRVAEIRLWVALAWMITTNAEWDALHAEDIDFFMARDESDDEYSEIMIVRAIKALAQSVKVSSRLLTGEA